METSDVERGLLKPLQLYFTSVLHLSRFTQNFTEDCTSECAEQRTKLSPASRRDSVIQKYFTSVFVGINATKWTNRERGELNAEQRLI